MMYTRKLIILPLKTKMGFSLDQNHGIVQAGFTSASAVIKNLDYATYFDHPSTLPWVKTRIIIVPP